MTAGYFVGLWAKSPHTGKRRLFYFDKLLDEDEDGLPLTEEDFEIGRTRCPGCATEMTKGDANTVAEKLRTTGYDERVFVVRADEERDRRRH